MRLQPFNRTSKIALFLFLVFAITTGLIAAHRAKSGSNDFDTFYTAGKAVLSHEGIYYQGEFYQDLDSVSPFLYPPAAACFFAVFALLPLKLSAFLWNTLNLALFSACLFFISRLLNNGLKPVRAMPWILFTFASFAMLIDNLTMAQVNIAVFFLCLAALYCHQQKRDFWAGMILSTAILLKVTPALFILYFFLKRKWRVLGGTVLGGILLTLLLPTLLLGWQQNYLSHRQWLGRSIKPMFISLMSLANPDNTHPLARSADQVRAGQLSGSLMRKNQSLEASLTRLLLKNRNSYAHDPSFPIYAARKYEKLPVLFGGLPQKVLSVFIRCLQAGIVFFLLYLWSPLRKNASESFLALEISLVFLSMTLLSPLARSHQFVGWLFPYATILWAQTFCPRTPRAKILLRTLFLSLAFYGLQALPYGKAAGMGTWANVSLWAGFVLALVDNSRVPGNSTASFTEKALGKR